MDKMKVGISRSARRMRENINYSVGLSERRDELESIRHLDLRNQKMIAAVKGTSQNLQKWIRSGNKEDSLEKRKRRLDDSVLVQQLQSDASDFASAFKGEEMPVLSEVMRLIGQALDAIDTEQVKTHQHIEKNIIDAFTSYIDEEKVVSKTKEKLIKATTDVEIARKRKLGNHDESKAQEIQDEYDEQQLKLETCKDNAFTDIYTLYSKQAEITNVYKELVALQMEYHRYALQKYENLLPDIDRKIGSYSKRPVFGCHLEDHLCYSKRSIAVVLEVCCTALKRKFFNEKGLFRINGNNNRIRRMKAAFDSHEITGVLPDTDENISDPHSICSVLKMYLRELPEPLLTNHLYSNWVQIARMDPDSRLKMIMELLPSLPEANRLNLAYLVRFLQLMLEYEKQTMMNIGNLSIVFGPNLLHVANAESENMLGAKLFETFLYNADTLFPNDKFDFEATALSPGSVSPTGGFDENRLSLCDVQSIGSIGKASSFRRSAMSPQTPSLRSRPKCPAPPPPHAVVMNQQALSVPPETITQSSRIDEISSSTENLPNALSKSPSIASSDSKGGYGNSNIEVSDELSAETSISQTVPSRPPPPCNIRRVPSPADSDTSQPLKRPASYLSAVGTHEVITPPPRRTAGKQFASVDENNKTVLHLETDSCQSQDDAGSTPSGQIPRTSPITAAPIPRPRLPAKPKSLPETNEFTKL